MLLVCDHSNGPCQFSAANSAVEGAGNCMSQIAYLTGGIDGFCE
jgi:hypothetical protein